MINVIQLADVEESFAMNMDARFTLDPSSFVALWSLSWEAALKTTRIELGLIIDINILLFNCKCIREGIKRVIYTNKRLCVVNQFKVKLMKEIYVWLQIEK